MSSRPSGHEWTRAGSPAVMPRRLHRSFKEPRVGSQAQVIVGAEVDKRLAIQGDLGALFSFTRHQVSPQMPRLERGQFLVNPSEWINCHETPECIEGAICVRYILMVRFVIRP